jgi:hypothetical protein
MSGLTSAAARFLEGDEKPPRRAATLELRGPVRNWSTSTKADTLPLRIAISSDPQILDGDNVQGVDGHNFTLSVNNG